MVKRIYNNYFCVGFSFIPVILLFIFFSKFLMWNEARNSQALTNDFIINHYGPFENNIFIFTLTYGLIAFGLLLCYQNKNNILRTNIGISILLLLRVLSLYLVPLEPPPTIIPLSDIFLANTFYDQKTLVKDLFFSGHTASVFILYFLVEKKWAKYILLVGGIVLGALLILQHVHYTIDVIFAPLFSYVAFFIGNMLCQRVNCYKTLLSQ